MEVYALDEPFADARPTRCLPEAVRARVRALLRSNLRRRGSAHPRPAQAEDPAASPTSRWLPSFEL